MNRSYLGGATGCLLATLLATLATAQEAYYPVSYGDAAAAAPQAAPAPAATEGMATEGVEDSGRHICYQYGLLAGPLEGPDPWTLSPKECPTRVGGWVDAGYTSGSDGLMNNRPGKLNLNQSALWIERTADGTKGVDWGYRADILYGTDGLYGQSFGNPAGT